MSGYDDVRDVGQAVTLQENGHNGGDDVGDYDGVGDDGDGGDDDGE